MYGVECAYIYVYGREAQAGVFCGVEFIVCVIMVDFLVWIDSRNCRKVVSIWAGRLWTFDVVCAFSFIWVKDGIR